MPQNKNLQQGFSIVEVAIIVLVVVAMAGVGWLALGRGGSVDHTEKQQQTSAKKFIDTSVVWDYDTARGWNVTFGTAPACPEPYPLLAPVDAGKATAVEYPGQVNAGAYRSHGSLRLNGSSDVVSPVDGYLYRGVRVQVGGRLRYSFDIIDPCGMMVRLGGLDGLTGKYQLVANKLPIAQSGMASLQKTEKGILVRAGEKLGTANTVEIGVYDLRKPNAAANTVSAADRELAWYGVCWPTMFSAQDTARLQSLPAATPTSKQSDYC